jgi:ABC-type molybdenum transport system ATPase subunit/photorepair protein PhrA
LHTLYLTSLVSDKEKDKVTTEGKAQKIGSLGSKKTVTKKQTIVDRETKGLEREVEAILKNISLDIGQRAKVVIVGKNGCGKRYMLFFIFLYLLVFVYFLFLFLFYF